MFTSYNSLAKQSNPTINHLFCSESVGSRKKPLISAVVISPPPHLVVFSVIVKRSKIAVVSPEKML